MVSGLKSSKVQQGSKPQDKELLPQEKEKLKHEAKPSEGMHVKDILHEAAKIFQRIQKLAIISFFNQALDCIHKLPT